MTTTYVPIHWNPRKRLYDAVIWLAVVAYLTAFITISLALNPGESATEPAANLALNHSENPTESTTESAISTPIILIRAFATCAFLMLTALLCIGPLARIDRRFLPLLYNRRHLGVSIFALALAHAAVAVYWYHAFGVVNPIASVFTSGDEIPFQALGALAFGVLFVMAATSHDYWNATLGAPLWKALHMGVYAAYALIIAHITFGALQADGGGLAVWMAVASVAVVGGLHAYAALAKSSADVGESDGTGDGESVTGGLSGGLPDDDDGEAVTGLPDNTDTGGELSNGRLPNDEDGDGKSAVTGLPDDNDDNGDDTANWLPVAHWRDIPDNRALTVDLKGGERIAVFRYDARKLAAVGNACQHQNGPLGEGCVLDGKITCPWHGYQYQPENGRSPPPFTERVATYRLALRADQVLVDPTPLPPGTARPVIVIPDPL